MTIHGPLFDFHGCTLRFSSPDQELENWLAADFAALAAPACSPQISITALREDHRREFLPAASFKTRNWHLLPAPAGRRRVWYPEGALCDYDYRARSGIVTSPHADLLKELSYLLILSRAGEALDLRGLHRLHAGALGHEGRALLLCGAQGAGKTTLLLELLKDKAFSLLSDDTPLIATDGMVYPFPARIGLAGDSPHRGDFKYLRCLKRRHYAAKHLLDLPRQGLALSGPLPPGLIIKLVRGKVPGFRRAAPGAAAAELARSLAAGHGVPQMAEYFLRLSPPDLCRKAQILASRLRAAGALLRKTEFVVFETGPAPADNAAALRAFLRSGSAAGGPAPAPSRG